MSMSGIKFSNTATAPVEKRSNSQAWYSRAFIICISSVASSTILTYIRILHHNQLFQSPECKMMFLYFCVYAIRLVWNAQLLALYPSRFQQKQLMHSGTTRMGRAGLCLLNATTVPKTYWIFLPAYLPASHNRLHGRQCLLSSQYSFPPSLNINKTILFSVARVQLKTISQLYVRQSGHVTILAKQRKNEIS